MPWQQEQWLPYKLRPQQLQLWLLLLQLLWLLILQPQLLLTTLLLPRISLTWLAPLEGMHPLFSGRQPSGPRNGGHAAHHQSGHMCGST